MSSLISIFYNLPSIFTTSLAQGLLWALLGIGVFITYRILDVADLTTEGTFPLGGAITGDTHYSSVVSYLGNFSRIRRRIDCRLSIRSYPY